MKNAARSFSALLMALQLAASTLTPLAHAKLDDRYDPNAYDSSLFPSLEQDCDYVCSSYVTPSKPSRAAAPGSDQWCANHGEATSISVPPQVNPNNPNDPGYTPSADTTGKTNSTPGTRVTVNNGAVVIQKTTCPFPLVGNEKCEDVRKGLMMCKLRNTQAESYCKVYNKSKTAGKWQKILLPLTFTAAATCGAVCAANGLGLGVAAQKACTYAGGAAGAAEILGVLGITGPRSSGYLAGFGRSVLGAAGAGAAVIQGGVKPNDDLVGNLANVNANAEATPAERAAAQKAVDDDRLKNKKNACVAAVTFGALTGIRALGLSSAHKTRARACEDVRGLLSQARSNQGAGGSGGNGVTVFPNTGALVGSSPGQSGSGGTTLNRVSNLKASDDLGSLAAMAQSTPDGQLLRQSGLDKIVAQQASRVGADPLVRASMEGNLGGALQRAMGGAGSGALGSNLASLTNAAVSHGGAVPLKGMVPTELQGVMSASGGGGRSGSADSDSSLGMGAFGGDAGRDPAAEMPSELAISADATTPVVDGVIQDPASNLFNSVSKRTNRVGTEQRLGGSASQ